MKRFDLGDWFVVTTALIQACAAISYWSRKRWLEGTLCAIYSAAYVILLLLSLRGRS